MSVVPPSVLVVPPTAVAQDAAPARQRWRVAELEGHWGRFVAPVVGAALVAVIALHRPTFRWLTAEDSLIEWAQFACYLGAAAVGAWVTVTLARGRGRRAAAALFGVFSVACFFIAGEEIAWGQRVLGLDTPEGLDSINHQGEITVHNISAIQGMFNVGFFIVAVVGLVVPWVVRYYRRRGVVPSDLLTLLLPPLYLTSWFAVVAGYKGARMAFFPTPRFLIVKYGEFPELCMAAALLLLAIATIGRLRRADQPAV